jgi:hypothetical protein
MLRYSESAAGPMAYSTLTLLLLLILITFLPNLQVISGEHELVKEGKAVVNAYITATGYDDYVEVTDGFGTPSDVIYVRRDLLA